MSDEINMNLVINTISITNRVHHWNEYCRTKVRGITKYDVDFESIKPNDDLSIETELGHIFFSHNGKRIGYLKPVRENHTAALIGSGFQFRAKVLKVTGGFQGKPNRGINLLIEARAPITARPVTQDSMGKLAEVC